MRKKGFTLIEMLTAGFVIIVGLIAVMSLMHRASLGSEIASSRLTAAYLAQEGLEIVRNIRDSNWLEQAENPDVLWDQGLDNGDWEADFDDSALTPWQNRNLRIGGSFYNYDAGTETKFKRRINLSKPGPNFLSVSVEVSWQNRGIPYSLSVQEDLYNWK